MITFFMLSMFYPITKKIKPHSLCQSRLSATVNICCYKQIITKFITKINLNEVNGQLLNNKFYSRQVIK